MSAPFHALPPVFTDSSRINDGEAGVFTLDPLLELFPVDQHLRMARRGELSGHCRFCSTPLDGMLFLPPFGPPTIENLHVGMTQIGQHPVEPPVFSVG